MKKSRFFVSKLIIVLIWAVLIALVCLALNFVKGFLENNYEKKIAKFISGSECTENGLRIISAEKELQCINSQVFVMQLVCGNVDDSDVFEVFYDIGASSTLEAPEGGYLSTTSPVNPSIVTGKQLKEGCIFSLKNKQGATIIGLPDNTSYTLTDCTNTIEYHREGIGSNVSDSEDAAVKARLGVVEGVYDIESGVETIGFLRTVNELSDTAEAIRLADSVLPLFLIFIMIITVAIPITNTLEYPLFYRWVYQSDDDNDNGDEK